MAFEDIIRMGTGHNLIVGNSTPEYIVKRALEMSQGKLAIGSFGIFDNGPGPETFTPAANAEGVAPKEADYILPIYRALSEVIVHKGWNPVDFGQKGVLKNSLPKLKGQTLYNNHDASVGNHVGVVSEVAWEESFKDTSTGIQIPAGINATMKVDALSNPRLARGILSTPPAVHSTSVTVVFLWEKSHASLSEEEFWKKLGSFDADGTMYRRIATNINRYNELSFVAHGADPYAQKKDAKGNINNPRHAKDVYTLSEARKNEKYFYFDFQTDLISNGEENTIPTELEEENKTTSDMNKYLLLLAASMGVTVTAEMTEEQLHAAIEAKRNTLALAATPNPAAATELTRLQGIETAHNALIALNTTSLTAARGKVLGIYNKLAAGKPVEGLVTLINTATAEQLPALELQYSTQLEAAFPHTCKKCGSHEITRASTIINPGEEAPIEKDTNSAMAALKEKRNSSTLASFYGTEPAKK